MHICYRLNYLFDTMAITYCYTRNILFAAVALKSITVVHELKIRVAKGGMGA